MSGQAIGRIVVWVGKSGAGTKLWKAAAAGVAVVATVAGVGYAAGKKSKKKR